MSRKGKNTREKELRARQRKEEIKKRDEMTLNAIKYALIAFGMTFILMLIVYIWQQHLCNYVSTQFQPYFKLFLGAGFLIDAKWCKKCRDNIAKNYVLFILYAMIFRIVFIIAGGSLIFYCAGEVLLSW